MTRQLEPEWDEITRGRAEGLAQHDDEACPGCGLHPSIADELGALTFEDRLCDMCAKQTAYGRILSDADKQWDESHPKADPKERRPADGRHTRLRQMSDEEVERRRRDRSGSEGPR